MTVQQVFSLKSIALLPSAAGSATDCRMYDEVGLGYENSMNHAGMIPPAECHSNSVQSPLLRVRVCGPMPTSSFPERFHPREAFWVSVGSHLG